MGHALVDHLARRAGIRLVAIKGPALQAMGLRDGHPSNDVDVLVDPERRDEFVALLGSLGWGRRMVSTTASVLEPHSVAIAHDQWPIEIDVHDRFPGLLAAPQVCFEALWRRRTDIALAHQSLRALLPSAAATIAALHYLRSSNREPELDVLAQLYVSKFGTSETADLEVLAAETASGATLAPFLERVGATPPQHSADVEAETSVQDWRTVQAATGLHSVSWVVELRRLPLRAWPRVIKRAVLLTDAEIRVWYPDAAPGWRGRWWGRVKRACVGLAALPKAVRVVWRNGR